MTDDNGDHRRQRRRKNQDVSPWKAVLSGNASGGSNPPPPTQPRKWGFPMLNFARIVIAIAVLFGLMIVGGSFYTIDSGERGVILRTGKVVGTADPGVTSLLPPNVPG